MRAVPEVHIAVNITPTPGAGAAMVQGSCAVSNIPIVQPPPGPSHPSAPTGVSIHGYSPLLLSLDCAQAERLPSIHELLRLMDLENPSTDLKYVDILSELQDHGVEDAVHLYSLGVPHLATFGSLDTDRAHHLHNFVEKKILTPLGLMKTRRSEDPSVEEVPAPTQANQDDEKDYIQPIKQESYNEILEWLQGVESCEEVKEEDELDELDESEGGYSGASQEV